MGRNFARFLAPTLVVMMAIGGALYLRATRPEVPLREQAEKVWPVAVVRADPTTVTPEITGFGNIVASRVLELRPLVAGEVVSLSDDLVDGGIVGAGDTLVQIDPFDFRVAVAERQAELDEAQARVKELEGQVRIEAQLLIRDDEQTAIAERELARRETLARRQAGSEKALDDARMNVSERRSASLARRQAIDRLAAQLDQARARVVMVEMALTRAQQDLVRTRLTAPFDGIVAAPDVALGKRVGTGDRLATLVEINRLEARFHLGSRAHARLVGGGAAVGRPVRVLWRQGDSTVEVSGTLARFGAEVDPSAGGTMVYARLEGLTADTPLRPGVFVEVRVQDRVVADAVRIPATAIDGHGRVFTVEGGRLVARPVILLQRDGDTALISGLPPATLVVITRFPDMEPGLKVTALPVPEA